MKILAIETSCDETSIAIIEKLENAENKVIFKVLAHNTISQINIHAEYGGVYPALARREHEKNLIPLLHKSLTDAELITDARQETLPENFSGEVEEFLERYPTLRENIEEFFTKFSLNQKIGAIAVTSGPGLPPALWVGVNFAKILSKYLNIPIYPINHMEGHIIGGIASNLSDDHIEIPDINYPSLSFLISGGHTEFVLSQKENDYQKIGETLDDAVGESYDKVARLLDLPYPGGPKIAELAKLGRAELSQNPNFLSDIPKKFPRPLLHNHTLNFSFSGLKTHVLYLVNNLKSLTPILSKREGELTVNQKMQIATEFEETVKEVFLKKLERAIVENNVKTVVVGGGVASNTYLRESFKKLAESLNVKIYISNKELSTDNALMIALTAAKHMEHKVLPTNDFIALGSLTF